MFPRQSEVLKIFTAFPAFDLGFVYSLSTVSLIRPPVAAILFAFVLLVDFWWHVLVAADT